MVQLYGAAQGHAEHGESVDVEPRASREEDALLGTEATARKPKREGHATLSSSISNLANTIIGSGELFRGNSCL